MSSSKLADDFPSVPDYRHDLASASANFGMLQLNRREFAARRRPSAVPWPSSRRWWSSSRHDRDYRLQRAATYRMLGILLSRTQRPEDAGDAFRKARGSLETLVVAFPEAPEYQSALGCAGDDLALLALAGGQLDAARHELGQALIHHGKAWLADQSDRFRRECLLRDYTNLATVHRRLKEPAAAAEAAQQLPRLAPDDPDQYSLAAWNLALCAALASQDSELRGGGAGGAEAGLRSSGRRIAPGRHRKEASRISMSSNQPTTISCAGGTISRSFSGAWKNVRCSREAGRRETDEGGRLALTLLSCFTTRAVGKEDAATPNGRGVRSTGTGPRSRTAGVSRQARPDRTRGKCGGTDRH